MPVVHHLLSGLVYGAGSLVAASVLLILALALLFAGRIVIKGLAFIVAGLVGATAGALVGAILIGVFGLIFGALAGFIIVGIIGYALVPIGVGIGLGYTVYELMLALLASRIIAMISGIVFGLIGIVLANKFLEIATVILGALLLYNVEVFFGLPSLLSVASSLVLGIIGYVVQTRETRVRKYTI